jgi:hypothetical protein
VQLLEAQEDELEDGAAAGARAEAPAAAGPEQVNRRAGASEHAAMAKQLKDLQKLVDAQSKREMEHKERDEKHRVQAEEQTQELRQLRDERRNADERERMARRGGARARPEDGEGDGGRFDDRGEESDQEALGPISAREKRTNKGLNPSQSLRDAQDQDARRPPPRGKRLQGAPCGKRPQGGGDATEPGGHGAGVRGIVVRRRRGAYPQS